MIRLYARSSLGWIMLAGAGVITLTEVLFQLELLKAPYQQWGLIESNLSNSLVVVMPLVGGIAAVLQVLGHSPGRISTMAGTRVRPYGQSIWTTLTWLAVSIVSVVAVLLICFGFAIATAGGGTPEFKLYLAILGSIVVSAFVGHVIGYLAADLKVSLIVVAFLAVLPMSAVNGFSTLRFIPILPAEKLPSFIYSDNWLNRQLLLGLVFIVILVLGLYSAGATRSRGVISRVTMSLAAPIAVFIIALVSPAGPVEVFEYSASAREKQVCEVVGERTVCVHEENQPELARIRTSLNAVDDVVGRSRAGFYEMKDSSLVDTAKPLSYGVGIVELKPGQGSRFGALLIEAISGVLVCGPESSESAVNTSFEVNDWLLSRVPVTARETFSSEPDHPKERQFNDVQMETIVQDHSEELSTCSYSGGTNAGS